MNKIRFIENGGGRTLLTLALAATLFLSLLLPSFALEEGNEITYKAHHAGENAGQVSRFSVDQDPSYQGCCAFQGKAMAHSGSATIEKEVTGKTRALIYKYAVEKDWWTGPEKDDTATSILNMSYTTGITKKNLVQISAQIGNQGIFSWAQYVKDPGGWSDTMIEAVKNWYNSQDVSDVDVPSSFEVFLCDAGNDQPFMIWHMKPTSRLKLKKASANTSITG